LKVKHKLCLNFWGGDFSEASNKVAFKSGMILLQSDLSTPSDASRLDKFAIFDQNNNQVKPN